MKQLEEARCLFDYSTAMNSSIFVRKELVYKSADKGVSDWSFPKKEAYDFDNYLVGIVKNQLVEFNFVFKNGDKSNIPMSNKEEPVVLISPADSVLKKVIVYFDTDS